MEIWAASASKSYVVTSIKPNKWIQFTMQYTSLLLNGTFVRQTRPVATGAFGGSVPVYSQIFCAPLNFVVSRKIVLNIQ